MSATFIVHSSLKVHLYRYAIETYKALGMGLAPQSKLLTINTNFTTGRSLKDIIHAALQKDKKFWPTRLSQWVLYDEARCRAFHPDCEESCDFVGDLCYDHTSERVLT